MADMPQSILIRGHHPEEPLAVLRRNNATIQATPRSWVMIDADNELAPESIADPTGTRAAEHLVSLLPPEFHDVSFIWQRSSSSHPDKRTIKLHLWFMLDRSVADADLKETFGAWNIHVDRKLIDLALFQQVQAHYTAPPTFEDGAVDPFKGRRTFLVRRERETVPLVLRQRAQEGPSGGDTASFDFVMDDEGLITDGRRSWLLRAILAARRQAWLARGEVPSVEAWTDAVWTAFQRHCANADGKYSRASVEKEVAYTSQREGMFPLPPRPINHAWQTREEGDRVLHHALTRFFDDREDVALEVPTGAGKTRAMVERLCALPGLPDMNVAIFVPTHDLGRQIVADIKAQSPDATVLQIHGRRYGTCERHAEAKAVQEAGISVFSSLCDNGTDRCPFYDTCPWVKQFRGDEKAIRVYPHKLLGFQRPKLDVKPDLVVIDENAAGELIRHFVVPALTLPDFGPLGTIKGAVVNGKPVLKALRDAGETADTLRAIAKARAELGTAPAIRPTDHDVLDVVERYEKSAGAGVRAQVGLLRVLADELETGRDEAFSLDLDRGKGQLHVRYRGAFKRVPEKAPVLFLDADLEPDLVRLARPGVEVHQVKVRPKATVVQVVDRSYSARWMDGHGDTVLPFLDHLAGQGRKVLVVTYKDTRRHWTKEADPMKPSYRMPGGWHVAHFGNIRGRNDWQAFDTAVVAGRFQPPDYVIRQDARALAYDREEVGSLADAWLRSVREAEVNQAAGRVRGHWGGGKTIYVLNDLPLTRLPVDQTVKALDDLVPGKLARLLDRFGAVPKSAAILARIAADEFGDEKAAKNWIERDWGREVASFSYTGMSRELRLLPSTGTVRFAGSRSPKPIPWLATAHDPRAALSAFGEVIAYTGPIFVLDGIGYGPATLRGGIAHHRPHLAGNFCS